MVGLCRRGDKFELRTHWDQSFVNYREVVLSSEVKDGISTGIQRVLCPLSFWGFQAHITREPAHALKLGPYILILLEWGLVREISMETTIVGVSNGNHHDIIPECPWSGGSTRVH